MTGIVDAYCRCAEHGDIFIARAVDPHVPSDISRFEPLRDDIRGPRTTDVFACPLCMGSLTIRLQDRL